MMNRFAIWIPVLVGLGLLWTHQLYKSKSFVDKPLPTYDFIIVGGGTAGCVLAEKLTRNGRYRVLLLESGTRPPYISHIPIAAPLVQGGQYDWAYRTTPQINASKGLHDQVSFWPRGKMLGGTGQMHFHIHMFGHPQDFESWPPGWNYEALEPYFRQLQCLRESESDTCSLERVCSEVKQCPGAKVKFQSTVTPLSKIFVQAGSQLGWETGNVNADTFSPFSIMASQNTISGGRRYSSYHSHLEPALHRSNLHVLLQAQVSKIVLEGTKTKGVTVNVSGKVFEIHARKEVILSAGAIDSPKLLLLSGIGPKKHLRDMKIPLVSDLPVGLNLQDHLNVPLYVKVDKPLTNNVAKLLRLSTLSDFLLWNKGIAANSGIEGTATVASERNATRPEGLIILFNMGSVDAKIYTQLSNLRMETFEKMFPLNRNSSQEGFILLNICLHPKSSGQIKLKSINHHDSPVIEPNYLSHSYDVRCLSQAVEASLKLVETEAFRKIGAKALLPHFEHCPEPSVENTEYMECLVRETALTTYHPTGTCPMGTVLDAHLRVNGVENLRVVDASSIPEPVSATPNSLIIAMAEKAADLITKEWKNKGQLDWRTEETHLFPTLDNNLVMES